MTRTQDSTRIRSRLADAWHELVWPGPDLRGSMSVSRSVEPGLRHLSGDPEINPAARR